MLVDACFNSASAESAYRQLLIKSLLVKIYAETLSKILLSDLIKIWARRFGNTTQAQNSILLYQDDTAQIKSQPAKKLGLTRKCLRIDIQFWQTFLWYYHKFARDHDFPAGTGTLRK